MPTRRGFIISIETYQHMAEGLLKTLPDTHKAALAFRDWLLNEQGLNRDDIYFCAEDASLPGRTADASRDDIVQELARLQADGQDKTDELYFLFIGHGFCYKDSDGVRLADIMLAADYRKRAISGNSCLKIDEIQRWLRLCMGPSDHFYFIDACRNDISEREIKVGSLGLTYNNSNLGIPTVYTLYSTAEGSVASANSGFVDILIAALTGAGRAKVWRGPNMAVLFRSVKDYVEKRLSGQAIDERKDGSRDGLIREFIPPPKYKCDIVVQNAQPTDRFSLMISNVRGSPIATKPFVGASSSFSDVPDDYILQLSLPGSLLNPLDPLPVDLYDNCTVRFIKGPSVGLATSAGPLGVTVYAPMHTRIVMRDLDRDEIFEGTGTFFEQLLPGRYDVQTVDQYRGVVVKQQTFDISGSDPLEIDLRKFDTAPLRDAILAHIPHSDGIVDMSESLGPTSDQGLDLWLAVMAASRIVGGPGEFSKLYPLPLASFPYAAPGASCLYVVAGFENPNTRLAVGLSDGAEVAMKQLRPHQSFPGLFEFVSYEPSDYTLVSVQKDNSLPVTMGACALPNRTTLITLTIDDLGALRVQQFILPIKHLMRRLSREEQQYFNDSPLRSVRKIVEIQRRFANSEELGVLLSQELDDILYMKWLDPIVAVLAAYELTRRGETRHLKQVVSNLRKFFGALPDTEALAKLAGLRWQMPEHPPLVLDGFLSLNMSPKLLPLDPELLDFNGPWTRWKGAITNSPNQAPSKAR